MMIFVHQSVNVKKALTLALHTVTLSDSNFVKLLSNLIVFGLLTVRTMHIFSVMQSVSL